MILFLYGPDTFRSRQYLRQSIEQFKKQRDPDGYNTVILDAKKEPPGKIFSEISATPFLAAKRMVVLENLLSGSDKEFLGELKLKIEEKKLPESNIIIFWQGEALSKVKEVKELQAILVKEKYAQEFELLAGAKLAQWVAKEITTRGGGAAPEAVNYLCQHAGHDLWLLHSLINQLVAYKSPLGRGGESAASRGGLADITIPDIQLFLDEKVDDNIFSMVDAVVSGNHRLAFKLLAEQRRRGEEEGHLFGLFIWQFRVLLEIADLLEREGGLTSDLVAKKLNIHPFVAKKNFAIAKKHSLAKLQSLYRELLDIDVKTKTGAAPQNLLVDLFVAKV